ncbi:M20 aminoacylase family protein [Vibrio sp.]|uniref:M20 aminoacylase family protein n=1 Tax=Vibrio sp. TaxID=678 RepID=UPI003D115DBB
MMHIDDFIKRNSSYFTELRRDIHQHPELGLEEFRTSRVVADLLQTWGYDVTTGLAKTGLVATIRNGSSNKVLGIRADMDALPMQENSQKAWSSQISHKFHGCGHDGHTTTLLFFAKWLAETKQFDGTIHLIFQPAEELLYGGKLMLDDGLFDRFPCDAIFALHNMPNLKEGSFHFRKGAMLSSSDTVEINIEGTGGHGAMPDKANDPVIVACHIATALQSIVSRNVDPFQPVVITIGSIQSGCVANIINDSAQLKLSIRTLNPDTQKLVLKRIKEIAEFQALSFNATATVNHIHSSPTLVNDAEMTDFAIGVAQELFDESLVEPNTNPAMASEDFAFMLEANPKGCYFFVGAGEGCSVHNPGYDFNDAIMAPAVKYWDKLVERFFNN